MKMKDNELVRSIARWTLPPGLQDIIRSARTHQSIDEDRDLLPTLASNRMLKGIHSGERCFILGTGPSISTQDLAPLRDEFCITLNLFYVHTDFSIVNPAYHVSTGLAVHPRIPATLGLSWFREMEKKVGAASLFLNYLDRQFVLKHGLFRSHRVHYLNMLGDWANLRERGIDATGDLYPAYGSAVMGIQVALYMGFDQIFLLGLDHDWVLRFPGRPYTHFYKPEANVLERSGLNLGGTDWVELFWNLWNLWTEYGTLSDYTEAHGTRIYNATAGGLLDVFERVDYDSLF